MEVGPHLRTRPCAEGRCRVTHLGVQRALTTSEGKEMPVDQLADTIPGRSVNECALMDRIARGDPRALEALYHRFHPKLARFLWRLIGRREGLEEIINDTFVDVCIA